VPGENLSDSTVDARACGSEDRIGQTGEMDFDLPADDHPARLAVRAWIAANPAPTGIELAQAGYVVPHWPAPYGFEASPIEQIVIDD